MIGVIPFEAADEYPVFMRSAKDAVLDIVAKGEFEQRDILVSVEVRVCQDRVSSVAFTVNNPGHAKRARQVAEFLSGTKISEALKIKAEHLGSEGQKHNDALTMALLESFHRAMETCLEESG